MLRPAEVAVFVLATANGGNWRERALPTVSILPIGLSRSFFDFTHTHFKGAPPDFRLALNRGAFTSIYFCGIKAPPLFSE